MLNSLATILLLVAAQEGDLGPELPACGTPVPIDRALLAAIPDNAFVGTARPDGGVLIGDLRTPLHGTVAFVRGARGWRA